MLVVFRQADDVTLTAAILLGCLCATAGFGPQYLLWPVPYVLLVRRPTGIAFLALSSTYTMWLYLAKAYHARPSPLVNGRQATVGHPHPRDASASQFDRTGISTVQRLRVTAELADWADILSQTTENGQPDDL